MARTSRRRVVTPLPSVVTILNPAIDDVICAGNPVLRGVVDLDSLRALRIDNTYQREILIPASRKHIMRCLVEGQRLPDIELAMRGDRWTVSENNDVILHDHVFILDGQQRRETILEYLDKFPGEVIRQGALVHFNTTVEWERERFHALNLYTTKVSASLLLRNLRTDNAAIATLYGLSMTDRDFPLFDRICWSQTRGSNQLITAKNLLNLAVSLHAHLQPARRDDIRSMPVSALKLTEIIGLRRFRENVKAYYESLEAIWGVRRLGRNGAPWLRYGMTKALITVFQAHTDFWRGENNHEFFVPPEIRNKLAKFPMDDLEVERLSGSSGQAYSALSFMLIEFINSGKRTHRLTRRSLASRLSGGQ